jgi:hypothetical protein
MNMDLWERYRKDVKCICVAQNGILLCNLDGQLRLNQLAQDPASHCCLVKLHILSGLVTCGKAELCLLYVV